MKTALFLMTLLAAMPAYADCYVDYKAKQDDPLRLHYGVLHVENNAACQSGARLRASVADRIGAEGWQLLNVMSVFDRSGLAERKENAGQYYLRF
jgi:hypothetical protein